ncbi:MAG: cob(I)yrinic acid a,c-diamide adenosyltransferase [Candidatus Hodarchaeales archaeon]
MNENNLGLVHVISGNGKGKTTSALGLALRAAGHGYNILIIQFMKKGWDYGELKSIELLPNIQILQYGTPEFVNKDNPKDIDLREARKGMDRAWQALQEDKWNIIILDEINVVIDFGLIDVKELVKYVKAKPKKIELVLTGRGAAINIIKLADYYTEICEHKHPYQKRILARKGVEF